MVARVEAPYFALHEGRLPAPWPEKPFAISPPSGRGWVGQEVRVTWTPASSFLSLCYLLRGTALLVQGKCRCESMYALHALRVSARMNCARGNKYTHTHTHTHTLTHKFFFLNRTHQTCVVVFIVIAHTTRHVASRTPLNVGELPSAKFAGGRTASKVGKPPQGRQCTGCKVKVEQRVASR